MKQISIYGMIIGTIIAGSPLAYAEDHCIDQSTGQLHQQQLDQMARMEYQNRLREWARNIGIEIKDLEAAVANKDSRLLATSLGMKYRSRRAIAQTHEATDKQVSQCGAGDRVSETYRPIDRAT